jgi:hypothetical protein
MVSVYFRDASLRDPPLFMSMHVQDILLLTRRWWIGYCFPFREICSLINNIYIIGIYIITCVHLMPIRRKVSPTCTLYVMLTISVTIYNCYDVILFNFPPNFYVLIRAPMHLHVVLVHACRQCHACTCIFYN